MVNKRLLIIGAVVALLFGGAIFFLSSTGGSEPPVEVLAARQDITAGTHISRIPDDAFARVPLTGDEKLLGSYLTETVWKKIQSAGGVLVQDVYQYEAIPLSAIASDGNPKAVDIPRLGLTDPDLVVVSLTNVTVPSGIKTGDYVDLVVAVERAQEEEITLVQPQTETFLEDTGETEIGEAEGTPPPTPTITRTPSPTLTPTPTPTPTLSPYYPLAKVIVRSAKIAGVKRDQNFAAAGDRIVLGEVTGVDVIIPREAQEFVLMSDTAGQLGLSMLSPMLELETDGGPTLGAHFEDLLDLFAADRHELTEPEDTGE